MKLNVLYVGPLYKGGTCLQRMKALQDLGHIIYPIDTRPVSVEEKEKKLIFRVARNFFGPQDFAGANKNIVELIKHKKIDIVWIDKGLTIKKDTLEFIRSTQPRAIIAGYSPDDMNGRHNQSKDFLEGLPLYHVYFTTKSYGVKELEELGCPEVVFTGKAFDTHTHRPMPVTGEDRLKYGGEVGFIGTYEKERADTILYLAGKGINIRVWGNGWEKCRGLQQNLRIEGIPLYGDDYAKALCSFDINLAFLRKINRDRQTARSIEIPATGSFMLAERSDEHLELFEEGKEAEFFGTDDECLSKINYYLENAEKRKSIAQAGYSRCVNSKYSYHDRLKLLLDHISNRITS